MKVGNCYNRAIFVEGKLVVFDINKTSLIKESDYLMSQLNKLFDIIYQHVCDKLVKYTVIRWWTYTSLPSYYYENSNQVFDKENIR